MLRVFGIYKSHIITKFLFFILLSDIDECDSNPCQNDGQCVDGVNSYTCECSSGYSGINCEISECVFEKQLFYHDLEHYDSRWK